MSTYQKVILSGSTNGRPIKVAATATPGTTIHTATSVSNTIDEIYIWATNTDSSSRSLTLEWGGTTDPDDLIVKAFPLEANSEPVLIVPGLPMAGGLLVRAFASSANLILIEGYVNRITQ